MAIWPLGSNKKNSTKKAGQSEAKAKVALKKKSNPYHCVELKLAHDACEEAQKLRGERFLSAEAPMVPLSGCDQNCRCKFRHHNDRRQDDRRDSFSPGGIHFSGDKNRRIGVDRRRGPRAQRHISLG